MENRLRTSFISGEKRKYSDSSGAETDSNERTNNFPSEYRSEISNDCQLCQKLRIHLLEISCPSTHRFCYDCFYSWIRDCILRQDVPKCRTENCNYILKQKELEDLPLSVKDRQNLANLISKSQKSQKLFRIRCKKCHLFIDQNAHFIHQNECPGRVSMIPCETCFCPIVDVEYQFHLLVCKNNNNTTLCDFIAKHVKDPTISKNRIRIFLRSNPSYQNFDVFDLIETLNAVYDNVTEIECPSCHTTVSFEQINVFLCPYQHYSCVNCCHKHLCTQMNEKQVLTCTECQYQLSKDDLDTPSWDAQQRYEWQQYQSSKFLEIGECFDDFHGNESTASTTRLCKNCQSYRCYDDFFLLKCDCKICYDCFTSQVTSQYRKNESILVCPLCSHKIHINDLNYLKLPNEDAHAIKLYQEGKLFEQEHLEGFQLNKSMTSTNSTNRTDDDDFIDDRDIDVRFFLQETSLPQYWTLPMLDNVVCCALYPESIEYKRVSEKFQQSWQKLDPKNDVKFFGYAPVSGPQFSSLSHHHLYPTTFAPTAQNHSFNPTNAMNTSIFAPYIQSANVPSDSTQTHIPMDPLGNNNPILNNAFLNFPDQQSPSTISPPFAPPAQNNVVNSASISIPPNRMRPYRSRMSYNIHPEIVQIKRIQNQRWYKQFAAHLCEMRQRLGNHCFKWLFHGCSKDSVESIISQCFNRSFAGRHATAFGKGCYFAEHSSYSHQYSKGDSDGLHHMFLAQVLVGRTAHGHSTMPVPPPGFDTTGNGRDIFVTYLDSQAYGHYLITYRNDPSKSDPRSQ